MVRILRITGRNRTLEGIIRKRLQRFFGEMSRTFALAEYQGNVANIKYMRSGSYGSNYGQQYDSEMPVLTAAESVIMYDYKYNQQNSLLNHFDRSGLYDACFCARIKTF